MALLLQHTALLYCGTDVFICIICIIIGSPGLDSALHETVIKLKEHITVQESKYTSGVLTLSFHQRRKNIAHQHV